MPADGIRLPRTRAEIAAIIPHQGAMCLLESVETCTARAVECTARSHASPDNPLLREGRLAAVHLCEYGAQAAAVHGALNASADRIPSMDGVLVALHEVHMAVADVTPVGTLRVSACLVQGSGSGWQYEFSVRRDGRLLASGRATVMVPRSP